MKKATSRLDLERRKIFFNLKLGNVEFASEEAFF